METPYRNDDDDEGGAGGSKLIPEWSVGADDQVVLAGLAVVGIMALLLGWNAWRGGDGDVPEPLGPVAEQASGENDSAGGDSNSNGGDSGGGDSNDADSDGETAGVTTTEGATSTTEEVTTTEAPPESTTTTEAAPSVGDVQGAMSSFPGDISGSADGTVAVLEGFVANDAESREAETAAAAVDGITEVENNLVVLEPAVVAALQEAGVTGATAVGRGTEISVSGTIDTEDDREAVLAAAAAVEGVGDVVDDRLNVSVTADLNQLPQVQFATNSAEILAASFGDLDAAAELLTDAEGINIEVQGYTDIQGGEAANLRLSQNRADAVRTYLVDAGVDPDVLSSTGFGETEQFGEDLASNRLVRFQQIDG